MKRNIQKPIKIDFITKELKLISTIFLEYMSTRIKKIIFKIEKNTTFEFFKG